MDCRPPQRAVPSVAALALAVLAAGATPAQQRISLRRSGAPATETERLVDDLRAAGRRAEAMARLFAAGAAVAPLLAHAVARADDGAAPALQLLIAFGGSARAVVPQLERLATPGMHREQHGIELAVAAIGTRDSVLFADFGRGAVVELDGEGRELRRVAVPMVWSVQPLAGDRLLVSAVTGSRVVEIDWSGKEHWSAQVPSQALDARRLVDGSTAVACWNGNCAVVLDPEGRERARIDGIHAVDIEPLWNGNFLITGHRDRRIVEATPGGRIVWELSVPHQPMDADLLPDGRLLVSYDVPKLVVDLQRDGTELRRLAVGAAPEDAARLADGRTAVADGGGGALLDCDGRELWRYAGGQTGHVVARIAAAADPAAPGDRER